MTLCNAILIANEACDSELQAKNVYGTALAKFQLGYLLKTYQNSLGKSSFSQLSQINVTNKADCTTKADSCFNEALKVFTSLNHLKGVYLSQ